MPSCAKGIAGLLALRNNTEQGGKQFSLESIEPRSIRREESPACPSGSGNRKDAARKKPLLRSLTNSLKACIDITIESSHHRSHGCGETFSVATVIAEPMSQDLHMFTYLPVMQSNLAAFPTFADKDLFAVSPDFQSLSLFEMRLNVCLHSQGILR